MGRGRQSRESIYRDRVRRLKAEAKRARRYLRRAKRANETDQSTTSSLSVGTRSSAFTAGLRS
jgi:hypothetical protein